MINSSDKKCAPFLEESHYSFLERSMEICIVDDDPIILETYSRILNCYPLYSVATFSSASEANAVLSAIRRVHVCIMDLGLTDIDNDEFYLVKKFSPRTSFVVLTGNSSIHTGFECGKHGSFSVFEKPVDFERIDFVNTLNRAFIYSLVNTSKDKHFKPIVDKIIEALMIYNPTNIGEWAYFACITEQYLRRVWNTIFGYQPKYFLWFYKMMTSAFSIYNKDFLEMNGVYAPKADLSSENIDREILAIARFFNSHKEIFTLILNATTEY